MVGYGIGAFGVGPLREAGGLSWSTIFTGTSALAAAMAVLAALVTRPGGAT